MPKQSGTRVRSRNGLCVEAHAGTQTVTQTRGNHTNIHTKRRITLPRLARDPTQA